MDFAAIGSEYYAERGGAFTGCGYTLRRKNAEPMLKEQKPFFRLKLQTAAMQTLKQEPITLELPAGEDRLRCVMEALNVEDFAEARIIEYAAEMLSGESGTDKSKPAMIRVDMTGKEVADEGMICGGVVEVMIEVV